MRTAVTMSTPASAASGMRATSDPPRYATPKSTTAWVIAARRVRPPERTFTAVRAMAPVAGMPPNSGATTLASPWPNSSRSGSCGAASLMPSATFAERRLSSPASSAIANAADTSSPSCSPPTLGSAGTGRPHGRSPMRGALRPATPASTDATITASNDPGCARCESRRADHDRRDHQHEQQRRPVALAAPRLAHRRTATAAVFSPSGLGTPSAVGTCCRKMITAMPMVKPSTTGQGM